MAWSAAIIARPEPEVLAAQEPDERTGRPSSHIINSALLRMGRYGAIDCVGPRPGTPPSESDSHLAGSRASVITRRFWTCGQASSVVLTASAANPASGTRHSPRVDRTSTSREPAPACRHPHDATGYGGQRAVRRIVGPPFIPPLCAHRSSRQPARPRPMDSCPRDQDQTVYRPSASARPDIGRAT
jgi:hypothetical protein